MDKKYRQTLVGDSPQQHCSSDHKANIRRGGMQGLSSMRLIDYSKTNNNGSGEPEYWYGCRTCGQESQQLFCSACIVSCHEGHDTYFADKNSKVRCMCLRIGTCKIRT